MYSQSDQDLLQTIPEDIFKCSFCKESYDLELHIPKVLISCNHYLCLKCLKNIFTQEGKCPSCNLSFSSTIKAPEDFPTDQSLSEILKSRAKTKFGDCQEHACSKNLFCFTDQVPICKQCALYGSHQGHRIQMIKVLQEKTKKMMKKLKDSLEKSVEKKQNVEQGVEEKLVTIQELIKNKFIQMKETLQIKRAELSENIENAVKTENETLTNSCNQNKMAFESSLAEISQLPQSQYDFITREDPTDENCPSDLLTRLEERFDETKGMLSRYSNTIRSLDREPTQMNETETQTTLHMPLQERCSQESIIIENEESEEENYRPSNIRMEEEFEESLSEDSEKSEGDSFFSDTEKGSTESKKSGAAQLDRERKVFAELKKELCIVNGVLSKPSKLAIKRVRCYLNHLSAEEYENILIKILKKILAISNVSATELEEWKQIIYERIRASLALPVKSTKKASKKHESSITVKKEVHHHLSKIPKIDSEVVFSSNWLEKYGRRIFFRNKVIKILNSLETRSFAVFHEQLLKWAKKLSKSYESWKFENLSDRRSWWYRYLTKDEEVADLWKSLPSLSDLMNQEYY